MFRGKDYQTDVRVRTTVPTVADTHVRAGKCIEVLWILARSSAESLLGARWRISAEATNSEQRTASTLDVREQTTTFVLRPLVAESR